MFWSAMIIFICMYGMLIYAVLSVREKLESIRPDLFWFVCEMEKRLQQHDIRKGRQGYKFMGTAALLKKLSEEFEEVQKEGKIRNQEGILNEVIDLACVCMMVADNSINVLQAQRKIKIKYNENRKKERS